MCNDAHSSKRDSHFKDEVVRNAGSNAAIKICFGYNNNAECL